MGFFFLSPRGVGREAECKECRVREMKRRELRWCILRFLVLMKSHHVDSEIFVMLGKRRKSLNKSFCDDICFLALLKFECLYMFFQRLLLLSAFRLLWNFMRLHTLLGLCVMDCFS